MLTLSSIRKVQEILSRDEFSLYDKRKGDREKKVCFDKDRKYLIPGYQREIRWSSDNVQILIDDLKKGSKFLGTITFSTSEVKKFDIIDGQQRITVITLIIHFLNECLGKKEENKKLCNIQNYSFPLFYKALEYKFDYDTIKEKNNELYTEICNSDLQMQRDSIKKIWNSIIERIEPMQQEEKQKLLTSLLQSDMNVIVNEIEETDTQRKFCVDYFVDINNKSVDLDSLDIIRACAFRDDFDNVTENWTKIQEKLSQLKKIKYSRDDLYFHYVVCNVNREIDYAISKLSKDYRIKENISVHGKNYASGTFIWETFKNDKFYSKLLSDINEYLDFVLLVESTDTGANDKFREYFILKDGKKVDETIIINTHTIIKYVLFNSDSVPKMMIMKYFFEVLKPKEKKKSHYKIITSINSISTIFTLSTKRKGSDVIAGKLFQEDWIDSLRKYEIELYRGIPKQIQFNKIIKQDGVYTVTSGQYAARRYYSMIDSIEKKNENAVKFDNEKYKIENITVGVYNLEHFAVNRDYKYALYLEENNTLDIEISTPRRIQKYIATLANYLIMDKTVNSTLMNRPAYEKIKIIEKKAQMTDLSFIIPSDICRKNYYILFKILYDESHYPYDKLKKTNTKNERKKMLKEYYDIWFEKEFLQVSKIMQNPNLIFQAELEYYLKKIGFYRNEYLMDGALKYNSDNEFVNIMAEINVEEGKITLSAELYNPTYGEKNDIYNKLVDNVYYLFKEKFHQEPCISSSNEYGGSDDESITFYIEVESSVEAVRDYLDKLNQISEKMEEGLKECILV